uniref:Uncharacterized protein n=1 Tax=Trypanosoma congolense (strain IL3000) TaxID=1068625 RepID=G0UJ72_TRYCI|nr:conserved hypothetical protein [Trypanosoma congolense IL3000]
MSQQRDVTVPPKPYFDLIVNSDPRVAFDVLHVSMLQAIERMEANDSRRNLGGDDCENCENEEDEDKEDGLLGSFVQREMGDASAAAASERKTVTEAVLVNSDENPRFVLPTYQEALNKRLPQQPDASSMQEYISSNSPEMTYELLGPAILHAAMEHQPRVSGHTKSSA